MMVISACCRPNHSDCNQEPFSKLNHYCSSLCSLFLDKIILGKIENCIFYCQSPSKTNWIIFIPTAHPALWSSSFCFGFLGEMAGVRRPTDNLYWAGQGSDVLTWGGTGHFLWSSCPGVVQTCPSHSVGLSHMYLLLSNRWMFISFSHSFFITPNVGFKGTICVLIFFDGYS